MTRGSGHAAANNAKRLYGQRTYEAIVQGCRQIIREWIVGGPYPNVQNIAEKAGCSTRVVNDHTTILELFVTVMERYPELGAEFEERFSAFPPEVRGKLLLMTVFTRTVAIAADDPPEHPG